MPYVNGNFVDDDECFKHKGVKKILFQPTKSESESDDEANQEKCFSKESPIQSENFFIIDLEPERKREIVC